MAIKKRYLKSKPVCKVTFSLPKEAAGPAKTVCIVGDFNNWKKKGNSLRKLKNGSFKIDLDLPSGREYQFRYLIDNSRWENDWAADKYVPGPYGDNSVVDVSGGIADEV
ncbi:MAG: isoamylase early set domain-containing protein [Desulfobulbaceae bacterium]|jgi:1,4-alpha-glucan branching enzyme|nr:isoamylase early set domain-containing protein [Desulfobulbaceae bacterium]MDY0351646.1 isoamylase early set domain-containing protein [Desulfobulbaceae bacterium]